MLVGGAQPVHLALGFFDGAGGVEGDEAGGCTQGRHHPAAIKPAPGTDTSGAHRKIEFDDEIIKSLSILEKRIAGRLATNN